MEVKLIAHTKLSESFLESLNEQLQMDIYEGTITDGQAVALSAIRNCYSSNLPSEIMNIEGNKYFNNVATDGLGGNEADRLIRHIMQSGHTSTVEHIDFTFAIEGVSRALLSQLTRQRIGFSYSVQSQRYQKYYKDLCLEKKKKKDTYKNDEKMSNKHKYTIGEETRVIDLYKEGYSTHKIEEITGIPAKTIATIMDYYDVEKRDRNNPCMNHQYFKSIDTHKKAQLLGFLMADGSVGIRFEPVETYRVSVEVHKKDGYYLQYFLDELGLKSVHVSENARGHNSISITSKELVNDLIELGMTPNKTFTLDLTNVINMVNEKYHNSFILGFFEGDGHLGKDTGHRAKITVGAKHTAERLVSIINKQIGEYFHVKEGHSNFYDAECTRKEGVEKFVNWIYRDIDIEFILQRKFITACRYESINKLRMNYLMQKSEENNFVMPEGILNEPKAFYEMLSYFNTIKEAYTELVSDGINAEDARFLLGQGFKTNIVLTANLRAILNLYSTRSSNHAQWEIRELVGLIKDEVIKAEPWTESFFKN